MIGSVLLIVLLYVVVLTVFITIIALRLRYPRVRQSSCGKCRYSVAGLTVMTCPECGSDLRTVGILTPGRHGPISAGLWITVWTLMLPIAATIMSWFVYEALPSKWTNQRHVSLKTEQWWPYRSVEVELLGNNMSSPHMYQTAALELHGRDGNVGYEIIIDLATMKYRIGDSGESWCDDPIDATVVEQWILSSTAAKDHERYYEQAEELLPLVIAHGAGQEYSRSAVFSGMATGSSEAYQKPGWFATAAVTFWIGIYVAGLVLITLWAERARRHEAAKVESPPKIRN